MRILIVTWVLAIQITTLYAQPQLKFNQTKQNFGFVKRGEEVKLIYTFINTGTQPLLIEDAKATCSCTSVDYSREPISPGKTGSIEIFFDTSPAHGRQDRIVEVFCNDPKGTYKIRFKGVVLE